LYSTLTRKDEEFAPAGDVVKMYVCGPNLYAPCHVGHAMSYVVFDVLRRYLEYRGYQVRHVQNFTDIEDKIIARAQATNVSTDDLAREYVERFFVDMDKLRIQRAHVYPLATHEIPGMIEMIQGLIAKGHAYTVDGDVYFRVKSDDDYGKLSGRSLDDLQAGARIEVDERKEDPMDFALWKSSKEGEPSWESPWGPGRPGWHIECSVMSLRYLGETLDIHGGGQDLIFPHHENELAQSESYTGKTPFVRFWVHNGLARLSEGEEKMTRSLGNLVSITDALAQHGADTLRLFILSSNYRSPLTYGDEPLAAAKRGVERLRTAAHATSIDGDNPLDATPFRERFIEAMENDLNTAQAMAALFDLARDINRARDEGRDIRAAQEVLLELGGIFGLTLEEEEREIAAAPFVEALIAVREELRQAKQFALADGVRSRLEGLGIILEDSHGGTVWKRKD
ncbi:MAG: cysteine--tRNA ligase, partial [Acidobacteria bacterium]|nr:cysteine--tRNA ligase [Acidobacteriota bacterium]